MSADYEGDVIQYSQSQGIHATTGYLRTDLDTARRTSHETLEELRRRADGLELFAGHAISGPIQDLHRRLTSRFEDLTHHTNEATGQVRARDEQLERIAGLVGHRPLTAGDSISAIRSWGPLEPRATAIADTVMKTMATLQGTAEALDKWKQEATDIRAEAGDQRGRADQAEAALERLETYVRNLGRTRRRIDTVIAGRAIDRAHAKS